MNIIASADTPLGAIEGLAKLVGTEIDQTMLAFTHAKTKFGVVQLDFDSFLNHTGAIEYIVAVNFQDKYTNPLFLGVADGRHEEYIRTYRSRKPSRHYTFSKLDDSQPKIHYF